MALGVGGTAVVQSLLTGLGLALADVPFTALLTGCAFVLCLIQVGTLPVLLPAVIWVFWSGDTAWGSFLLVWSVIVGSADNVLRPLLIQRGVDLPFWLVFTGVVGGLLAFGLVGLFIGPVVLAVARMLLTGWLADGELHATGAPGTIRRAGRAARRGCADRCRLPEPKPRSPGRRAVSRPPRPRSAAARGAHRCTPPRPTGAAPGRPARCARSGNRARRRRRPDGCRPDAATGAIRRRVTVSWCQAAAPSAPVRQRAHGHRAADLEAALALRIGRNDERRDRGIAGVDAPALQRRGGTRCNT